MKTSRSNWVAAAVVAGLLIAGGAGAQDPIIHYTFDGDTGTTAIDSATADGQQDMTITGSFTTDAERGQVLNATGGGSFTRTSTSNNYTFAGWYKGTAAGYYYDQSDRFMLSVEASTSQDLSDGGASDGLGVYDNIWHNSGITTANDGTWHHIAWILEKDGLGAGSDSFSIYLDGVAQDVDPATPGIQTQRLLVNGIKNLGGIQKLFSHNSNSGSTVVSGLHDDVRIYDRALSAAEIAALGGTSDTTAPTVSTLVPADGGTVATPASITVTFDEDVATNTTGSITITNITAGAADIIPVGSAELVVSGSDLVITPTTPALASGTHYAVLIDTNAIKDLAGNFFAGFTNTVDWDWDFTTTAADTDGPTLVLPTSPADNATDVGVGVNLVATFNENIAAGSGNIIITNLTDGTVTTIAASDGSQVSISTSSLTVNPTENLLPSRNYAILIEADAITDDPAGNPFAGIMDANVWNFTTEAVDPAWDGSASATWSDNNNWAGGAAPANGDDVIFTSGNPPNQPSSNDISNLKLKTVTFANGSFTAPLTLGGNAIELDTSYGAATTLSNANTTAGRNVTLSNNLVVTGNQGWSTPNSNGVTIIAGNLSGAGSITITNNHDATLTLPALRLNGANSSYTGNIILAAAQKYGIMLMKPSAMIGGSIRADDTTGGTRPSVWVNAAAGTYTFGVGTGPGEVALKQPSGTGTANSDGLHVTGGNMSWDPGNGNDYALPTSNPRISLGAQLATDPTPWRIDLGTAGKRLILQSAGLLLGHSMPGTILNIQFALSDDGTARPLLAGDHANTWSLGGLVVLNSAATGGNLGGTTTLKSGALAVSGMNQLFNGNLNLSKDSGPNLHGGALVLDNVSWADFLADRSGGYGTGANQWQLTGGGFAARGTPLTIGPTGTDATTFNTNFVLGAQFKGTDGAFYANAPVTLAQNTTLTAQRTITAYATGPGLTGGTADGVELRISGNLSGPGSLYLAGNIDGERISEIVLAGANSWDGAPSVGQTIGGPGSFFNVGPGGLAVGGGGIVGQSVFARFASPASLPTGGSGTRWLGAVVRGTTDFTCGFLFTGDADGEVYDLTAGGVNRQVVIGSTRSDGQSGAIGGTDGQTILRNAPVVILGDAVGSTRSLVLLARPEAELILGDGSGAARLIPAYATYTASASATQDPLTDRTGSSTLVKRGEGTVVLGNLAYTKLDGTPLATSQFAWQMGRGSGNNSGSTAYFDGAVRGLSYNDPAAGPSNSLASFYINFNGAVYEIDNSGGGSGTFTAGVGGGTIGNVGWPNPGGSGGFSAYGGPVTVTLNSGNTLTWASDIARAPGYALIMGSRTANAALTWSNPINLNGAAREIRVYDNTNSTGDKVILSGVISGTGASGITKAGDGVLVLSGANTYAGATTVAAGSLYINGSLNAQSSSVTVNSGTTLGGTGTINRAVSVQSGAFLAPGDYEDHGTLTIASNVTIQAGAVYQWSHDGASGDSVQVNGTLTLPAAATVVVSGSGDLSGTAVLFNSPNPLEGATDLSGWTVDGISGASVNIVGSTLVLAPAPKGMVFILK